MSQKVKIFFWLFFLFYFWQYFVCQQIKMLLLICLEIVYIAYFCCSWILLKTSCLWHITNVSESLMLIHHHSLFVIIRFSFFVPPPPSIYRDARWTLSWSSWCSELWCRHLGNARKVKQWIWCVILSHRKSHWETIQKTFSFEISKLQVYFTITHLIDFLSKLLSLKNSVVHFGFCPLFVRHLFCAWYVFHCFISLILSGFGFL